MTQIYTDGTGGPKKHTRERPPRSGWGFCVVEEGRMVFEACAPMIPQVTTNAAELEAMIRAVAWVHSRPPLMEPVEIWTDSTYVADTFSCITHLADGGFCLRNGKPISNQGQVKLLYDFLFPLGEHQNVRPRWVEGHSGIPGNERADELAAMAAYKGIELYGPPQAAA